ncbi:MAG: V-type ATP synthase subunit F, partial [Methanotrichaceae archaeon]|nr:V-type ATP synthase subunit F [Methanotrichaceae archaeon]
MEIAVIGSGDSIIGFSLAGIKKTYEATSEEEIVSNIEKVMADPAVGILVLSQKDYNNLTKRMQSTLSNSVRPTVIAIGTEQSTEMREKI